MKDDAGETMQTKESEKSNLELPAFRVAGQIP